MLEAKHCDNATLDGCYIFTMDAKFIEEIKENVGRGWSFSITFLPDPYLIFVESPEPAFRFHQLEISYSARRHSRELHTATQLQTENDVPFRPPLR